MMSSRSSQRPRGGLLVDPGEVCEAHLGSQTNPETTKETPVEHQEQYVAIDLDRRSSVIVRRSQSGETLEMVRIETTPRSWRWKWPRPGSTPEVILEAHL
jgi:hypothetical protein